MELGFERADLQGNILRGYKKNRVRYLLLEIAEVKLARLWLGQIAADDPGELIGLTRSDWGATPPELCFNVSLTAPGLKKLCVTSAQMGWFPDEFREGMHTRGPKIGDTGDSAPANWEAPFDSPDRLHVIATLYADKSKLLDEA